MASEVALKEDIDLSKYQGRTGAEGIEDRDVIIPRLKIGQALSDEVKKGQVKEGDLFLNIDARPLWTPGEPALQMHVIAQSKDYVLWRDRNDDDGGIMARAVAVKEGGIIRYKWDKPDTEFTTMLGGKMKVVWKTKTYTVEVDRRRGQEPDDPEREDTLASWGSEVPDNPDSKPAASANHNYLVMLPSADNAIAVMTLTRTGSRIAKKLNSSIRSGTANGTVMPLLRFRLSTFEDTSGLKPFRNWFIVPDGVILPGLDKKWKTEDYPVAKLVLSHFDKYEEGAYTQAAQQALEDKKVDDDIPF